MNKGQFVGERLELARTFQGLTLTALANQVSASAGLLSHYENGRRKTPSASLTSALAIALKVRPGFFYQPVPDVWRENECSFRRRAATPETSKKQARAHGSMIGIIVAALTDTVRMPEYNIPSFHTSSHQDIEAAAIACRKQWELGNGPIQHIGRVAERNGILLIQNLWHSEKVDAFSRRGTPVSVIVINSARDSTSRWIFDVAHELGHFALHEGIPTSSKETEDDANYFASALLLPMETFGREFTARPFSWQYVFQLKKRWCVSAAAILRRSFNLGLLDGAVYRFRYKQLYAKGWAKKEPCEPAFVGPEWLNSAIDMIRSNGRSVIDLCNKLEITLPLFSDISGITVDESVPFKPIVVLKT